MTSNTLERLRIARELHDGIAQDLVALGYRLDLILGDSALTSATRAQVRSSRLEIDSLISKVRQEILELRRSSAHPLHQQIEVLTREICAGMEINCEITEVPLESSHHADLLAITAEILRNVMKHAGASLIAIHLYPINNRTYLEIRDDGVGGLTMKSKHWGLQGVVERVNTLGGSIDIESVDGTRICILI